MGKCVLCNKRKGKRYCIALEKWICSECCGEKRYKEVNCSPKCVYIKQAQEYSLERVEEVPPPWNSPKLWDLHLNIERITYNFMKENPNFTDEEYKEVVSLLEKEYDTRRKGLFLPPLSPRSSRGMILKNLIQEFLKDIEKRENEFGLPIFTSEDILKVFSWEKERIERYQQNNKNVGPNFFLQILRRYVEINS